MEIGGAERSLLGLLNAIDTNIYDIDLFVYRHTGEFMELIPKKINLLKEIKKYTTIERPISEIFFGGYVDIAVARFIAKLVSMIYIRKNGLKDNTSVFQYISDFTTPLLPELTDFGEYDVAISFLAPHNIVRDKIKAGKKIAWIHTDYSTVAINSEMEFPVWNSFDHIVSISESARFAFLGKFPGLKDKVVVIENILSPQFVREQAHLEDVSSEMPFEQGLVRLLSVGRYSPAKNFDNVPYICSNLIKSGINVKWYIIGFGGNEDQINDNIKDSGMEGRVILLGKKSNPFPYMKECDFYVQPSRYEGKAVTVREAQILHKLVAITNFPTSKSQLEDKIDGVIVPMDNVGATKGLMNLILDKKLQSRLINNLHTRDYGNEEEIVKLYELISLS